MCPYVFSRTAEGDLCTYLRRRLARLLLSLRLLFGRQNFAPLRVALDGLALLLSLVRLLQRGLHVLREADVPNDRHKPLAAEHRAEDLLGVDEAALWCGLLRPELVVLLAQRRVRERLVRDGDLLEAFLGVWVVRVLVRVELDCKASWEDSGLTEQHGGIYRARTVRLLDIICRRVNGDAEEVIVPSL